MMEDTHKQYGNNLLTRLCRGCHLDNREIKQLNVYIKIIEFYMAVFLKGLLALCQIKPQMA